MEKKNSSQVHTESNTSATNLPVSKQTAGGVAGAIVGGVIAGPIGAVAGAIAGTLMGNRAAEGKSLVSASSVKKVKDAVKVVQQKLPAKLGGTRAKAPAKSAKSSSGKKAAVKKTPKTATKAEVAKVVTKKNRK